MPAINFSFQNFSNWRKKNYQLDTANGTQYLAITSRGGTDCTGSKLEITRTSATFCIACGLAGNGSCHFELFKPMRAGF